MRNSVNLFLVICLVGLSWTIAAADGHRDGYSFRNGKVVMFRDGKESFVTAEVSLSNGSRLLPDGFIVFKDGRRERFRDDRWLSFEGEYIVVDATDDFDGYYYEGGKVYVMRERRPVLVTVEVTLTDGSRIGPDGFLVLKDGSRNRLSEGQRISREGKNVERREAHQAAGTREKPIDTSRKIEDNVKNRETEQKAPVPEKRDENAQVREKAPVKREENAKNPTDEKPQAPDKREEKK